MTYDISDDVKQAMAGSLGEGDAVQLPFSAAFFWCVNGDPRMQDGVQLFGGWATSQPEFEAHMHSLGQGIPAALQLKKFVGEQSEYQAYTARALAVAPIAYRKRNASDDPARFRSHVQLLGYAITGGQDHENIGPVILTAKGYQASNIIKAFTAFEKASAEQRRVSAGGLDAKFFYVPVGTFGDKPNFVSVGKAQQSKITPIEAKLPDPITAEYLEKVYVGKDVAEQMAVMKQQAQDWLKDWADKKQQSTPEQPPAFDDGFPTETPF